MTSALPMIVPRAIKNPRNQKPSGQKAPLQPKEVWANLPPMNGRMPSCAARRLSWGSSWVAVSRWRCGRGRRRLRRQSDAMYDIENARAGDAGARVVTTGRLSTCCIPLCARTQHLPGNDECVYRLGRALRNP